jgi:hypothetical protein
MKYEVTPDGLKYLIHSEDILSLVCRESIAEELWTSMGRRCSILRSLLLEDKIPVGSRQVDLKDLLWLGYVEEVS